MFGELAWDLWGGVGLCEVRSATRHPCLRADPNSDRRGTMMAGCAARAARAAAPLYQSLSVHLVEIHPAAARKAE